MSDILNPPADLGMKSRSSLKYLHLLSIEISYIGSQCKLSLATETKITLLLLHLDFIFNLLVLKVTATE